MSASILVFGGGSLQLSIIESAKKMGYLTIVIDPDGKAPGKDIADVFYTVPGDDYNRTLEIALQHKVKGIVTTATDKPILMMSRIAGYLKLPFPSYESCELVLDKAKFKQFLFDNKLPHARGILVTGKVLLDKIDLSYPVITKPVFNSGSRGVIKSSTKEELIEAVDVTLQHSRDGMFLIEEFIEGNEISVEALVQKGKVHIVQLTDKIVSPAPYNVEMGHIQPSKYSYLKEKIRSLLQTVVDKSGLDNCALHPELKIRDDIIIFIEIGPRLGGDFITSHLVPLSTGLNMEEQLINIATGLSIELNNIEGASLVSYLNFPKGIEIKGDITLEELKKNYPELVNYSCELEKGATVREITNSLDRYGQFILKSETKDKMQITEKRINSFIINSLFND